MAVVLAIDAGTTGVRTIAVQESGRPGASAYREFTQHFPRPGWVEHDATEIWQAVLATMAEVVAAVDEPVAAIGITNQRETVVAWDRRTGTPRHRAIVWQDRRTAGVCDALRDAGHLPHVRETTGLVLDPYFSGTKFAWLLGEGGVAADDALALGTIDSWLVWNLTGGQTHVTDTSNASRTMLLDITTLQWSEALAEVLGVPLGALPQLGPSSGVLGHTVADLPCGAGIPIAGIAGDQQAALFGQACFEIGAAKNTYGTGSFVLMNVGSTCPPPVEGLLTTVAWTLAGPNGATSTTYAYEGAIFITGAAVQWLRDGLGIIDHAAELEPLALQCEDTGGVYLVPAFTGLGSPWWDPYARGTIVGITRGTGRPQLARAVIEAMVHQTRDVVDAMSAASGHAITTLKVDGGASIMATLLQLQADQLGVRVERPVVQETTAMGAAYLAGLAVGVWSGPADVTARWALAASAEPAADRTLVDAAHAQWRRAVERSLAWDGVGPPLGPPSGSRSSVRGG
jgi:glycerol kinase